jgi:hypothetical protein
VLAEGGPVTTFNVNPNGRISMALAEKTGLRPVEIHVTPLDVPGAYLVNATFIDGTTSSYILRDTLLHQARAMDLVMLDNR